MQKFNGALTVASVQSDHTTALYGLAQVSKQGILTDHFDLAEPQSGLLSLLMLNGDLPEVRDKLLLRVSG